MITATELKNSTFFLISGTPFQVVKYTHKKMGRGGANVKLSLRNLLTGKLEENTFASSIKFEEIKTLKRALQFLYSDDSFATFMDPISFEQVEINTDIVKDQLQYIKEGESVNILFWEEKPLIVEISPKVVLKVKETDPGIKGNSATNVYKPATLENRVQIKVPLFIKVGDKVKVDTRSGEYIERSN